MNLARRILEGIHEVELEITPEFRKPSSLQELEAALKENGWKESSGASHGVDTLMRTWSNPDLLGARIKVAYNWKTNELIKDTIAFEKGLFSSEYSATPQAVKMLTDAWRIGAAKGGAASVRPGEYPIVDKHPAVTALIWNRPWLEHMGAVVSAKIPVLVKTQPGDLEAVESVKSVLDASDLTYEHVQYGKVFRVFGSPGMADDEVTKAFTSLITHLDDVLGGPKP